MATILPTAARLMGKISSGINKPLPVVKHLIDIFVTMIHLKPMSRIITAIFCLVLPLAVLAQKKAAKPAVQKTKPVAKTSPEKISDAPFMLKGFANAFPDSILVVISSKTDVNFRGPSAYIKNGQFLLTGTLPGPGIYNLLLTNPKQQQQSRYIDLFLANEPSAIRFTGTGGDFEVLEGPSMNALLSVIKIFGSDFDTLSRLQQMRQNPMANVDSINTSWINILERVKSNVPGFITQYHATPVAPFLLCTIWPVITSEVDKVQVWVNQIDSSAMQNDFGYAIREYVANEKMFGYGQVAPDFVQNDPAGQPVQLRSFRGKYVLIDFWASWCGPCRLENPNVVSAYNKYKDKNFTILGVSLDRDKPKWLQAIQQDQLNWTHVSDLSFWNNAVAKLYRIQSIPQNFMLDPEGRIIGKNLRGEALDSFLEQVLPKK
jgi:peroxiredoxin